jgi:hypothetical protein
LADRSASRPFSSSLRAAAFAQTGAIAGKVKGPDGQPVKGCLDQDRTHRYQGQLQGSSTNKKGEYFHAGPPARHLQRQLRDRRQCRRLDEEAGCAPVWRDPKEVDFDLAPTGSAPAARRRPPWAKAAETGKIDEKDDALRAA